MEFEFSVNQLFPSEITKLDRDLIVSETRCSRRLMDVALQRQDEALSLVIDRMGDASAKAQGLHCSITTYAKLLQSNHTLYIVKDEWANNDKGVIIGILKMGAKRLFLSDARGNQHEMHPICVLDFYVHETYQRKGCGKRLFDFMLKDKHVTAAELAIDRPSSKLLTFLSKHYYLSRPIHQRNHFTVYEDIFPKILKEKAAAGRYSDPSASRSGQEAEMPRIMSRRSFPPSVIKPGSSSSSVASVVFGQTFSKNQAEDCDKSATAVEEHRFRMSLACQDQHRMEYSKDFSENRSGIDSSFNIFGIPSPANRAALDVRQNAGSAIHEDRRTLY